MDETSKEMWIIIHDDDRNQTLESDYYSSHCKTHFLFILSPNAIYNERNKKKSIQVYIVFHF